MKSPPDICDLYTVLKKAHPVGSFVHRGDKRPPVDFFFPHADGKQWSYVDILFYRGVKRVYLYIISLPLFSKWKLRSRSILKCMSNVGSVSMGFDDKNTLTTKLDFFHISRSFNASPILLDNEKTWTIERIDEKTGKFDHLMRRMDMCTSIFVILAATLGRRLLDKGLSGIGYWYVEQPPSFCEFAEAAQKMLAKLLILDEKSKLLYSSLPTVLTCLILNMLSLECYLAHLAGQVLKLKQLHQSHKVGSRVPEKYEGKSAAAVKGREPEKGKTIKNDNPDLSQEEQDTELYTAADIDENFDKTKDKKDGGDFASYRHSRSTEDQQDAVIQLDPKLQANELVRRRPSQPQIDDLVHISKKNTVDNSIRKIVDDGILKYKSTFARTNSPNSRAERHKLEHATNSTGWLFTRWVPRDQRPPPRRPHTEPILNANPTGAHLRQLMSQRNFRMASMVHLAPDIEVLDMSEAGLYLDEAADEFRCHRCCLAVPRPQWPQEERPADVHRRLSPGCPVVNRAVDRRNVHATNGGQEERRHVASRRDRDVDRRGDSSPSGRVGERKESSSQGERELQRIDSEPQTEREVLAGDADSYMERKVQKSGAESPSEREEHSRATESQMSREVQRTDAEAQMSREVQRTDAEAQMSREVQRTDAEAQMSREVQRTDAEAQMSREVQRTDAEPQISREVQRTDAEPQIEKETQGTDTDALNKTETKGRQTAAAESRDAESGDCTYGTEEEQSTWCSPVKQQGEEVSTHKKDGEQRVTMPTSLKDTEETQPDTFQTVEERNSVVVQEEGRHPVTTIAARDDRRDAAPFSVKDTEAKPDASSFTQTREDEHEYFSVKAAAKPTDSTIKQGKKEQKDSISLKHVAEQSTEPTSAKDEEEPEVSASAKEEKGAGYAAVKIEKDQTNSASENDGKETKTGYVGEREAEIKQEEERAEEEEGGQQQEQKLQEERCPSFVNDFEEDVREYHSTTNGERDREGRWLPTAPSQGRRTGAFCDSTTGELRGAGLERYLHHRVDPIINNKSKQQEKFCHKASVFRQQNLPATDLEADCEEQDSPHLTINNSSSDIPS